VSEVLVIGYGNPGRLDDGLGPAFAQALEQLGLPGVEVEVDYQLMVEHAAEIARHRLVVFADAAASGPAPFSLRRLAPRPDQGFSTHRAEPGALLALAGGLFGARVEGYALGIRGYEFDSFGERLSPGARANLEAALRLAVPLIGRMGDQTVTAEDSDASR
jgi:hydrogenase maturation protease